MRGRTTSDVAESAGHQQEISAFNVDNTHPHHQQHHQQVRREHQQPDRIVENPENDKVRKISVRRPGRPPKVAQLMRPVLENKKLVAR